MNPSIVQAPRPRTLRRRGARQIVEIVAPSAPNPLHVAFVVLRRLGVEIVHARVLAKSGKLVQQFQLSRLDGATLTEGLLADALEALREACGVTPRLTWAA